MIAGLHGPTIHGYERLLDCVSFLIEQTAWRKNSSKNLRRVRTDCERILNQSQRPSRSALHVTEITGLWRSTRISNQPQRRSARIERQQKTYLKFKKTAWYLLDACHITETKPCLVPRCSKTSWISLLGPLKTASSLRSTVLQQSDAQALCNISAHH